ncbi:hypothetical protein D3C75_1159690 [compost metagenome]
MRQIGYGLNRSFKNISPQLVEHNREQYRNDEAEHESEPAHSQRISQYQIETFIMEKLFEIFKPYPFLISKGLGRFIILKCHQPSPQGHVAENKYPDHERK